MDNLSLCVCVSVHGGVHLIGPRSCETALAGWVLVTAFSVEVPETGTDKSLLGWPSQMEQ